jgi:hypothetical protein
VSPGQLAALLTGMVTALAVVTATYGIEAGLVALVFAVVATTMIVVLQAAKGP